jgi:uncharacterized damage-inducible protein DinB
VSAQRAIANLRGFVARTEIPTDSPELVQAAQRVLTQGLDLLILLGQQSYSRRVAVPFNSSIGQHYRHVLEHFQCLMSGLAPGVANYDARERNPRVENEVSYASVKTCEIITALRRLTKETLQRHCTVITSVGYGSTPPAQLESNVSRELAYCTGHAIHHYAIICLLCGEMGVVVPAEFGIAPSTLKHTSTLAAD